MINGNEWFVKYQKLPDDEKEIYKEYVLGAEEKAIVLDYERFIKAIELLASEPDDLRAEYNKMLNMADEVALTFDNEGVYIAHHLKSENYISEEVYNLVIQIDKQLESLSNEHNEKNWTIQAMKTDQRWIKARVLANEVTVKAGC